MSRWRSIPRIWRSSTRSSRARCGRASTGGVAVELLQDVGYLCLPAAEPEVRTLIGRLKLARLLAGFRGALDGKATTAELEHVATLIPEEWLASAATGSPEQCAAAVLRQLDLGADGVILHGASPAELAPVVEAYRRIRPAGRFDHLVANPAG